MTVTCEHCKTTTGITVKSPEPHDEFRIKLRCPECGRTMENASQKIIVALNSFDELKDYVLAYQAFVTTKEREHANPRELAEYDQRLALCAERLYGAWETAL